MGDVYLRPLAEDDEDRIFRWHNSEELYRTLEGQFRPVLRENVRRWLAERTAGRPGEAAYAICRASGGEHIGNIYLKEIDAATRTAELHIFIGDPAQRGHGFGTAAVRLLLRRAWDEFNLDTVYLHVLEDNAAAIQAYRKCGFALRGELRDHVVKDGRLRTALVMAASRTAGAAT